MKTTEIKCDECGKDLTYTGNCEDYYLVLGSGSKAPWYRKEGMRGGAVTAMALSPPVNRKHHFCGFKCLDAWRDAARAKAAAREKFYDENKTEIAPGMYTRPKLPPELQ